MLSKSCSPVNCSVFQISVVQIGFSTPVFVEERMVGKLTGACSTSPLPLLLCAFSSSDLLLSLCSAPGHRGDDEHGAERAPRAGAAELREARPGRRAGHLGADEEQPHPCHLHGVAEPSP